MKFRLDFLIASTGILLSAFFIYILNPVLHYHTQQIAWLSNFDFLKYYLRFAGGPAEYFALFISRLFYYRIIGSFLLFGLITLSVFFLRKITDSVWQNSFVSSIVTIIFPIAVVALMCDYRFYFSVILNMIIVLKFLYLGQLFSLHEKLKTSYFLLAGIIIYYISGGAYFIIYMFSSVLLSLKKTGQIQLVRIFSLFIFSLLIPFIFYKLVFPVSIEQAFFRATPDVAPMLRYNKTLFFKATFFLIPLIILISIVGSHLPFLVIKNHTKKVWVFVSMILIVSVFATVWFLVFKPQSKIKAEIDFNANSGEWNKVIELTGQVVGYDRMVNYQYNRAISYKGEMLDKLFNYPQLLGTQSLFLDKPFTSEVALPSSDLYFDLGNIDESQRFAFEAQTLTPNSPRVISRLTVNSIILENYNAAKTFCNLLSANPIERKRIKHLLSLIDEPDLAATDPLIAGKRKLMNKPEGIFLTPRDKLLWLLTKNQTNKMAFEYLIAFDLMEHDLAAFTNDIKYFPESGYKKLPVVIEEAVLLFLSQRPENSFLKSFRLSQQTTARFREFVKIVQQAKGDKIKAKQAASKFKNTYWYYVLFTSPLVTKVQLETRPSEANY